MSKNLKKLKSYLNENGLRFNLNKQRIWKYIEEIFGENRAQELSDIFDETYIEEGKGILRRTGHRHRDRRRARSSSWARRRPSPSSAGSPST